MPSADEAAASAGGILQPILDEVVSTSALGITLTFTLYNRVALTSDGTVFWVKTSTTMDAVGSLHYAVDIDQDEDRTLGMTRIVFTSQTQISEFNTISPTTMWIANYKGPESDSPLIRFGFSTRGAYHDEAKIWHYSGLAIFPTFDTQIVDDPSDVPAGPIVSNSTPIWLAMTALAPVYPSFLVPQNLAPPYVVAGINDTIALSGYPVFQWPGSTPGSSDPSPLHSLSAAQQLTDDVELTFYGFNAAMAAKFLGLLMDSTFTPGWYGLGSDLVVRDHKAKQSELQAVAQKKTVRFRANYNLNTADAVGRRLILQAGFESFTIQSTP